MKKDCFKRKNWFEKKCDNLSFVCFETNLVHVPSNTWWLDLCATIHVPNFMQGFLTTWSLSGGEKYIEMGNWLKFKVIAIRTYRIILDTSHVLYLHNTFYVPFISRNLFSLSKLDLEGCVFNFGNQSLYLYIYSFLIEYGVLCDGSLIEAKICALMAHI